MKKLFFAVCVLAVVVGTVFAAQDTITAQDATKTGLEGFRTKVNANFGRIPATIATNVTAQTATVPATVTPQAGPTVTATSVVTPQAGATVTATAAVTPQTVSVPQSWTLLTVELTDTNGVTATVVTGIVANVSVDVCTNATAAITIVNGEGLLTNATVVTSIANGAGLLTNATATVAGVTTNVLVQTKTP